MISNRKEAVHVFIHTLHLSSLELTAGTHVVNPERFRLRLDEYAERAFLLADENDYIILNHKPDKDYLTYLANIALGTKKILVPTGGEGKSLADKVLNDEALLNFLRKTGETEGKVVIHPYVSTRMEARIAETINADVNGAPPNLTEKINSKIYLRTLLRKLDLPVPEYEIADLDAVADVGEAFMEKYKKIVIAGERSYGGMAVWPLTNKEELAAFIAGLDVCKVSGRFVVEKMYDFMHSPNLQYDIGRNAIREFGVTDQILDNKLEHHGNRHPTRSGELERMKRHSCRICEELQSQGYRGLLGIDFIETRKGEVFAVDMNGRANASSFGLKAIRRLFPDSYQRKYLKIMLDIDINERISFSELAGIIGKDNIFNAPAGQGILPYNIGCLKWGKYSALIIADTERHMNRLSALLDTRVL